MGDQPRKQDKDHVSAEPGWGKRSLSEALHQSARGMTALARAEQERIQTNRSHMRSMFVSLFIELTEEPSDPMYGEKLDVRLDYKNDTYRLRVSSPEGPLTDAEMRRVLEVLEGTDDEPDKYVGLLGTLENNGIEIKTL